MQGSDRRRQRTNGCYRQRFDNDRWFGSRLDLQSHLLDRRRKKYDRTCQFRRKYAENSHQGQDSRAESDSFESFGRMDVLDRLGRRGADRESRNGWIPPIGME